MWLIFRDIRNIWIQLFCLQVFLVKCGVSIHFFNPYKPPAYTPTTYGFTLDNSINHYTNLMQNISQYAGGISDYPHTLYGKMKVHYKKSDTEFFFLISIRSIHFSK